MKSYTLFLIKKITLFEYQQQTENLITLKELLEKEKESMPQENFDLIWQDFVILQIERWIDENNEIIDGWFEESDQLLKSTSLMSSLFWFHSFSKLIYLSGSSYRQRQPDKNRCSFSNN